MKLARKEIIQACEKQMLKMLVKNLDKSAVKSLLREKYDLSPGEDLLFHGGDIAMENNEVVYKLDFSLRVGMTVMLDREGEYVDIRASQKNLSEPPEDGQDSVSGDDSRQLASDIARMLSEINQ
ncbi:hypothetical protein HNR65_000971 [Desulfosalsimonas propionicica]|uniref:Uncharacterized protein n=1 Tax=Desulfosalsimonas propionicica TaxID=332175 RepID=A0A7W0HK08_9BACT|nr:hypothetical protein [Desulfosalsimonas propionicica]MBA2880653.1 hypothetical protein [Desulfosalsimonas propionicica]